MNKSVHVSLEIIEQKFQIYSNFASQSERKGYSWMTQKKTAIRYYLMNMKRPTMYYTARIPYNVPSSRSA